MAVETQRGFVPRDRKAELKAKGDLTAGEAAEYLDMSVQTFYNRRNRSKAPGMADLAPQGQRNHMGRLIYRVAELEAWKKRNTDRT